MTRTAMVVLAGLLAVGAGVMVAQQGAHGTAGSALKAHDAGDPAWSVELHARHGALVKRRGPGTDAALREKLLAMAKEDQAAPERGLTQPKVGDEARFHLSANARETDNKLTAELKEIVAKDGWPTIAMAGIDASNGAMLILAHTTDHAWQLSLLPKLEKLSADEEIDGSMVALVVDKELVAEHKLQRYGTQFKVVDGQAMMFAVEDPQGLDARRAKAFLPPMAAYREMLEGMYHLKVSDMIVRP